MVRSGRLLITCGVAAALLVPAQAEAKRRATASESASMWKVADKAGQCAHKRGSISTVRSTKWQYGVVTIGDATCGDGSFILRRPKAGGKWTRQFTGSDFSDLCRSSRPKVPKSVLRDLGFCS